MPLATSDGLLLQLAGVWSVHQITLEYASKDRWYWLSWVKFLGNRLSGRCARGKIWGECAREKSLKGERVPRLNRVEEELWWCYSRISRDPQNCLKPRQRWLAFVSWTIHWLWEVFRIPWAGSSHWLMMVPKDRLNYEPSEPWYCVGSLSTRGRLVVVPIITCVSRGRWSGQILGSWECMQQRSLMAVHALTLGGDKCWGKYCEKE